MSADKLYDCAELAVVYPRHLIVEVETAGGIRNIETVEGDVKTMTLEHDERLFASRGEVMDWGLEAASECLQALRTHPRYWHSGGATEIIYEPKSDTLVIHPAFSRTGRAVVLVSIDDVLAIVPRDAGRPR